MEKLYLKGSGIATKGQPAQEPYALKGWADIPGKRAPDEFGRAVDNLFHVRRVNGKPYWVACRESIGPGCEWDVKDRFNALVLNNGYLPNSYAELAKLASTNSLCNWRPPYLWLLYGALGIGKTRSLQTFPGPIRLFDFDRGSSVLTNAEKEACQMEVIEYDPEESDDYSRFLHDLEACMP
ncbi:MAG TPA: hypothetical protein VFO39_21335 [Candidatus Sulfotelmatobacter sp.]|nr:hypothetical protein [Candidatus Sulfotelmatobacter sp.]